MRVILLSSAALLAAIPAAAAALSEAAEPFVASRDPAARERAVECLTQAVYYEARSESEEGQRAVAQVVLNRVRHRAYPNSVCGVVFQGSERSTGCQFSFTCDGSMYGEIEPYAWDRARRIAEAALGGSVYRPVGLATNYHTTAIEPYWAPSLVPQTVVGAHIFYRRPGGSGTAGAFSQSPAGDEPDAAPAVRYAAPRTDARSGARTVRASYEIPVTEIPVVERPVRERTIGPRRASASASSTAASRPAPVRSAPRVVTQRGVRVYRGS
ncbi:MAG TPA: cell wall hydrolase [Allosphingosinicella sp.]|nr:cell wall hydrolase [Allosphingosinicella sp.]